MVISHLILKKNYYFLFFVLFQINTVLMFLDYFDTLILKIILKNVILIFFRMKKYFEKTTILPTQPIIIY